MYQPRIVTVPLQYMATYKASRSHSPVSLRMSQYAACKESFIYSNELLSSNASKWLAKLRLLGPEARRLGFIQW